MGEDFVAVFYPPFWLIGVVVGGFECEWRKVAGFDDKSVFAPCVPVHGAYDLGDSLVTEVVFCVGENLVAGVFRGGVEGSDAGQGFVWDRGDVGPPECGGGEELLVIVEECEEMISGCCISELREGEELGFVFGDDHCSEVVLVAQRDRGAKDEDCVEKAEGNSFAENAEAIWVMIGEGFLVEDCDDDQRKDH